MLATSKPWRTALLRTISASNSDVSNAAQSAAQFCAAWFANRHDGQPWLIMAGKTGTGKTHIAKAIRDLLRNQSIDALMAGAWGTEQNPDVTFWHWPRVCGMDRPTFETTLRDGCKVSCLIIDDIGAEGEGYKNAESLVRLLDVLEYRREMFLLLTTNVPRDRWEAAYDMRIADRLRTAAHADLFGVPSYRLEHKRA